MHRMHRPNMEARWIRVTGIRATRIRATGILATGIRIRAMQIPIRAMAVRVTWIRGHLRRARMATTPTTLTHARPTVTMGLAGFRAESLLASGPGGAGVGTTSLAGLALEDGATMEAGGPFPGAEDIAVGSLTVTPVEADEASVAADVPSMALDAASPVVDVPLVAGDVASVAVDVPSVAGDVASVAVDVPSVAGDMPSVEAEAEAVPMGAGAGRFHPQLKALAADGICCRPLRFLKPRSGGILWPTASQPWDRTWRS